MITVEQMEKINAYYEITLNGYEISIKVKKTGKEKFLHVNTGKINFGFDAVKGIISKEEKEKLEAENKIMCFDMKTFLKDYFNLTDEQVFELQSGQDKRTQEALKKEAKRIGLIDSYTSDNLVKVKKVDDLKIFNWGTTNEVYGWTEEGEFLAQIVIRYGIDDFCIECYKFKNVINQEILDSARMMQRFIDSLESRFVKSEYHKLTDNLDVFDRRIPEDKLTHWLDNSGETIIEKIMLAMREQGKA